MALVIILGGAAILMTFPRFSDIGTTVFASAGVLSVVAGLAAQTSLGAVFAGMQIAFSGAIRVGDVVQLENGQWWGRIEEITLSYVVVRLWDERRLVLPCTYFTTEPFENWTRSATEIMGAVEFDVDFSVPFADMRAELDRLLAESDLWDGRRGVLQVTDAVGGMVRVRIVVSAPNAGALFDLRCAVREGMVNWVQHRGVLPTQRIEAAETVTETTPRRDDAEGETKRVASSLFSGSPEADARARAFDDTDDPRRRLRQPQRPPLIAALAQPPDTHGEYPHEIHAEWRCDPADDAVARIQRTGQPEHTQGRSGVGHRADDGEPGRPARYRARPEAECRDGDEERHACECGGRRQQERRRVQRIGARLISVDQQPPGDIEPECDVQRRHEHHGAAEHHPTGGGRVGGRADEFDKGAEEEQQEQVSHGDGQDHALHEGRCRPARTSPPAALTPDRAASGWRWPSAPT